MVDRQIERQTDEWMGRYTAGVQPNPGKLKPVFIFPVWVTKYLLA